MTPIDLVDELVEFLKKVIKNYDLSTKMNGISKRPSVYAGYLPTQDEEDDDELKTPDDYPCILVRFIMDQDDINQDDLTSIRLIIGTYSIDDQSGWRDTLNIATRIKTELKKQHVFGPFSLIGTVQTELFEEQLRPYWHGIMDIDFCIPQVQAELEMEDW